MSEKTVFRFAVWNRSTGGPWSDLEPVREELFGIERLEHHALSLAAAQPVTQTPPRVQSLHKRLNDNARVLLDAYRASAAELENSRSVVPAAEWLLDNYHLVEEQIREIRNDLPPGFYRQLPKLAEGPFAGYPRVFGIAWAFVAHTDSNFDPDILRRFIAAYQRVQPLEIGELWAVAITLRIVLIENLRRLADQITSGQKSRADAEALASRLVGSQSIRSALETDISSRAPGPLSEAFAAHLAKRLRDQDPRTTPALGWLEERLGRQGTSIDEVVLHGQQRQGASNVTVRNIITSMRLISDIDWAELFEKVSLVDERLREASAFGEMDFSTRNLYRSAIEQLARGSSLTELEVTARALDAVSAARAEAGKNESSQRIGDPGYHLIAEGRPALERAIGFRAPVRLRLSRMNIRLGVRGYVGSILALTVALVGLALWAIWIPGMAAWLALFAMAVFLPATELATALVNRAVSWTFSAAPLPGLELKTGVPASLRTLVAVPTLLTSEADLREQIERLEVHYLGGASGDLAFALLLDGLDADHEVMPGDEHLLLQASDAIAELNRRYGPCPAGTRFMVLHRRRVFNAGENKWMGWERKRGKLHELNRLLRGATDTSYIPVGDAPVVTPAGVRYVITLDADTRLPRDAALRLVGKMAHPLNRPHFDEAQQRVVNGYAILQPRVTPSLPVGSAGSVYQRVFSSPGGMDPYAAAVSDVYQDLFGEGSYTGKGIYDVDAFEAALAGRIPPNTLLSHDLFEGIFARAGLASDVEVVEEFPSRYDVDARRQHRWVRGDWQLLPWIVSWVAGSEKLPSLGRGKMLDNLRRSMLAPATLIALVCSWLLPVPAGVLATLMVLACIALPPCLPSIFSFTRRSGVQLGSHIAALATELRLAALQVSLSLAFLPDRAWRMGAAIATTLFRLFITRRNLLEWTTAAQLAQRPRLDLRGFYQRMAEGTLLAVAICVFTVIFAPASWLLAIPFVMLWLAAPALALWASRPQTVLRLSELSESDARVLRLTARRTWRFFETFVTPADSMLPPDNFQEDPKSVLAHRTSPTNIGLYMLSAIAARDFGWAGTVQSVERLEATMVTMQKLARFNGHFFNWYDTQDLGALEPAYVSSVDSGNLAGHLIVVANACEEWIDGAGLVEARLGMLDNLHLARQAIVATPVASGERGRQLTLLLDDLEVKLGATQQAVQASLPRLRRLVENAVRILQSLLPAGEDEYSNDALFWIRALGDSMAEHSRDETAGDVERRSLEKRIRALADGARELALAMDFAFLMDSDRSLLSIGYSQVDNSLDPSCYDLLASEARLASLFAIAKGDVATRHWLRLGRTATPLGKGSALVSWSGSMFEYLMPSLIMRAPYGSLLEQTNRLVVERQQAYGDSLSIPWGISESAYNARDIEFTYQYSNFGVPGLGLKRGLSENTVIAPYATGLATMVDPAGACRNFVRLTSMEALGRYGFYEALDFTASRLPDGKSVAIVRNFMAHHQGMTIVAIANSLLGAPMRDRFHREPMIQACELLLQERMPRDVAIAHPRAEEVNVAATNASGGAAVRRLAGTASGAPITHLLSNGRYTVMLTNSGAGYSRWRDIAVTRWREDSTRDDCGSFVFMRDTQSGKIWSTGLQPVGDIGEHQADVMFAEDYAEFIRRDGTLTTTTDILVSGEDDGEVRRVSLTNSGRRAREIEVTSYSELVLTLPAADNAHPAFAKMFVVTSRLPEFDALVATRRKRSPHEPEVWAAHFAVVEGQVMGEPQYESDRERFLGRGREAGNARAILDDRPLSNTVGTVLDPVFALRYRVLIPPGKVARIAFWTVVGSSQTELINLIDKHHDRSAFERAKTLAWTQAQVQLRHLGIGAEEAADFQRLAAPVLYADPAFRASSNTIMRGAGPQSNLWPQSISGDLPIVLLRIDDIEDIGQLRQLLRAHEYWRMKRLAVDLVIINERASSYIQDLQIAIETAVRSSQSRPRFGGEHTQGTIYTLRADLMSVGTRGLLQSVARVALIARSGTISEQLARMPQPIIPKQALRRPVSPTPEPLLPASADLEFFNGLGGFDKQGREYVTLLSDGQSTPAPWINVIANAHFGFQVSADGSGYTWAENSRENQITPWSNDPVGDPAGEAIYIRDEVTGLLWTPTAQPVRGNGTYVARHGQGYSRYEHVANEIGLELLQYVPLTDPIKISRLTVRNLSDAPRRLSVTAYAEWVLGTSRGACGPFVVTTMDEATGAMLANNPWSIAFPGRTAFADLNGCQTAWTADRTEFIGRNGSLGMPAALMGREPLSGKTGAGLDPCSSLQGVVELAPGQTKEIVWFLGQCGSADEAIALVTRYRQANLDEVLQDVTDHWDSLLGAIQVRTPDRAMDIMLNGWLLYQTLACRIWARSAFYQASGAYGFRDQLQDGMALTFAWPDATREHILRAAGRQFVEGDVQHWWLSNSGQGVRTRISDDRVWLAFATATYVCSTGDATILEEVLPFLEGPLLRPEEHDAFFQPMASDESASLYEHCARGLDQCMELTGRLGLPLMGTGDWNDGMNRVGEGGKGESVWLGWLLLRTIDLFLPCAQDRDAERAKRWRTHATSLKDALERQAWDGQWYRRATFDDGSWLGSKDSQECRIDSIAQSWAVLSGAADPQRAAVAMASLEQHLIRHDDGVALLFTPPFDSTSHNPGYIKGYPPGLRENGGQYSHAAMWAILAFTKLGEGETAAELFALLNPVNHARTREETERYKVEPYVVAADVYSVAPHVGRGGWTWYTGSAAWMYRAGVEGILGIRREGNLLVIEPCIPDSWPRFDATVKIDSSEYDIRVENASSQKNGAPWALLDDVPIDCAKGSVRVLLSEGKHSLAMAI